MALRDHIALPIKSCRMWGDVYDANDNQIYTNLTSGPVLAAAINVFDDMHEAMRQVDLVFDGIAAVSPLGEHTAALAAKIKTILKAATPEVKP